MSNPAFSTADEYDKALVFALKKWISDEIYSITDSGVNKASVCVKDGFCVYFAYGTEGSSGLKQGGLLDDNAAVSGSTDIWLGFKGYAPDDEAAKDNFAACVNEAARQLEADGIIKERFGRSVPIVFGE